MENAPFYRTEMLLGKESMEKLAQKKVAIFGLGGVGSYVVEGLIRSGINKFYLVDCDVVSITNLNRQIIATHETIGQDKTKVCRERMLSITPDSQIELINKRFCRENIEYFSFLDVDYIVDAIDIVTDKIFLIEEAKRNNIPIISCMGTGNKLDPSQFVISDISKSYACPLAKVIRKELKDRNINNVKVLFSKESNEHKKVINEKGRNIPASISFVPSIAGLLIAREVIMDLII